MERRSFVGKLTLGLSAAISAPFIAWFKNDKHEKNTPKMIKKIRPLGFQWETLDPFFILCSSRRFFS